MCISGYNHKVSFEVNDSTTTSQERMSGPDQVVSFRETLSIYIPMNFQTAKVRLLQMGYSGMYSQIAALIVTAKDISHLSSKELFTAEEVALSSGSESFPAHLRVFLSPAAHIPVFCPRTQGKMPGHLAPRARVMVHVKKIIFSDGQGLRV